MYICPCSVVSSFKFPSLGAGYRKCLYIVARKRLHTGGEAGQFANYICQAPRGLRAKWSEGRQVPRHIFGISISCLSICCSMCSNMRPSAPHRCSQGFPGTIGRRWPPPVPRLACSSECVLCAFGLGGAPSVRAQSFIGVIWPKGAPGQPQELRKESP